LHQKALQFFGLVARLLRVCRLIAKSRAHV
jgi:hypothetical protein